MMNNIKVKKDFLPYRTNNFLQFFWGIIQGMTAEAAFFTLPSPTIMDMTDMYNDLREAAAKADTGGKDDKALRDSIREKANNMVLDNLSYALQKVTPGAQTDKLLALGYGLFKRAESVGQLPPVEQMEISSNGVSGQAVMTFPRIKGAFTYRIEVRKTSETAWTQHSVSTRARNVVGGLDAHTQYGFRASAIGAGGIAGGWSEEVIAWVA
ncbi:MAG: hypothetical protein SH856_05685 [Flavobacteriales bacterium]|nr:hypothetical protein [Flavobacteriales bacterium]